MEAEAASASMSSGLRRADATKILAMRILQGYTPTNMRCTTCSVPLMDCGGIIQCVVCTNAAAKRNGEETSSPGDGTPMSRKGKGRRRRKKREKMMEARESRNDEEVVVTEDGVELLPRSFASPQERESMDSEENESTTTSSTASLDDILNSAPSEDASAKEMVETMVMNAGDDLFNKTVSTSAEEEPEEESATEGSLSSGGSKNQVMKALFMEAIDELARRGELGTPQQLENTEVQPQPHQKQNHQPDPPAKLINERKQRPRSASSSSKSVSTEATRVKSNKGNIDTADEQSCYSKGKAFASQIIQDTNSILDDLNSVTTPTRQHQGPPPSGKAGKEEKEMACYQKGKAFASQIIQETNSILDDLNSIEHEGKSVKSEVSHGVHVSSRMLSVVEPNAAARPPPSPSATTTLPPKAASSTSASPTAPVPKHTTHTPPTPGARKRMTINNLSNDQGLSRDHTQVAPSTGGGSGGWLGYTPRRLGHVIHEEESGSSLERGSEEKGQSGGANKVDLWQESACQNNFLDEIRHKALLTRAMQYQNRADDAIGTKGVTSGMLHIETEAHDGEGNVDTKLYRDDVSALESPSFFSTVEIDAAVIKSPSNIKASASTTNEELQQRWRAANNRQLKQKQLAEEMGSTKQHQKGRNIRALGPLKRIDSCVPDDEKREIALQCIREEGVVQPFDESAPKSPSLKATRVASISGTSLHSTLAAPPSKMPLQLKKKAKDTAFAIDLASLQGAEKKVVAPMDSPSLRSLSSSVKQQTKRIAELEANALEKHREAEAAAAIAREALKEMARARDHRRGKRSGAKDGDGKDAKHASHEKSGHVSDNEVIGPAKNVSKEKPNDEEYSEASASQYSRRLDEKHIVDANGLVDDVDTASKPSTIYDEEGDSSTISSSYLSRNRRQRRSRGRSRSPRRSGRTHGNGYYPTTPKAEGNRRRQSRPPPLQVNESTSSVGDSYQEPYESASTFSTLSDKIPIDRHHRSLSASRTRGGRMKANLLLPTLCSPDPAGTRAPSSNMPARSHSASPRHHRMYGKRAPAVATTKPNLLLPYSPHGGYVPSSHYREPRSAGMRGRPAPLSTRTESDPISNQYHQSREFHRPSVGMAQPHHSGFNPDGGLPPFSPRQYSASLAARMANLDLDGRRQVPTLRRPYGGASLTPKSIYEQQRFGFDFNEPWHRSNGPDRHFPVTQSSMDLAYLGHEQERMNRAAMLDGQGYNQYSPRYSGMPGITHHDFDGYGRRHLDTFANF